MNDWQWRRGAVYAYGPAVAKVWEEKERYIYLHASTLGDMPTSEAVGDLVRMIRGTLLEIVAEYKNLKVQEQVRWDGDWLPRRVAESLDLCEPEEEMENFSREERP